jgi:two-component sensor histidine kinase
LKRFFATTESTSDSLEFRIRRLDGQIRCIRSTMHVVRDVQGEILEISGLHFDITQQKKSEDQVKNLLNQKEALLLEVNHRVKNNLAALLGILHLEQDKTETGKINFPEILKEIETRIQSLAVVHSLLSSREWEPVNLTEIIKTVVEGVLSGFSKSPDVRLNIAVCSFTVTSSTAHHLALVLSELTTNSVKHATRGRTAGAIEVFFQETDGYIVVEYLDNGPGFTDTILEGGSKPESIGFDLIKGIIEHTLRGKFEVFNDNGAHTRMSLPIEVISK